MHLLSPSYHMLHTPPRPTPGVLNELMQKKEVPPFLLEFAGEGVTWTATLTMGDDSGLVFSVDEPMRSQKASQAVESLSQS